MDKKLEKELLTLRLSGTALSMIVALNLVGESYQEELAKMTEQYPKQAALALGELIDKNIAITRKMGNVKIYSLNPEYGKTLKSPEADYRTNYTEYDNKRRKNRTKGGE